MEVGCELRGRRVPVVYMAAKCGGTEWCLGFQQMFALDCQCFPVCHTECTVNKQTWNFINIYSIFQMYKQFLKLFSSAA